jgi:hypothetical protein
MRKVPARCGTCGIPFPRPAPRSASASMVSLSTPSLAGISRATVGGRRRLRAASVRSGRPGLPALGGPQVTDWLMRPPPLDLRDVVSPSSRPPFTDRGR